jgi:hypothetical protein
VRRAEEQRGTRVLGEDLEDLRGLLGGEERLAVE